MPILSISQRLVRHGFAFIDQSTHMAVELFESTKAIAQSSLQQANQILTDPSSRATLTRPYRTSPGRIWVAITGINSSQCDSTQLDNLINQIQDYPGVRQVRVNYPLSRLVIDLDSDVSVNQLCHFIDSFEPDRSRLHSLDVVSLPGDGLLLLAHGILLAVSTTGVFAAISARIFRRSSSPIVANLNAGISLANYQPWLRNAITKSFGKIHTDFVLRLITISGHALGGSITSVGLDLLVQVMKTAELYAGMQAWDYYEPILAQYADQEGVSSPLEAMILPQSSTDRYRRLAARGQLLAAGLVGGLTRNLGQVSKAITACPPRALNASQEAFACMLTYGLVKYHGLLPLNPTALRQLDTLDVIIIDPRVLYGQALRIVDVRYIDGTPLESDQLNGFWEQAQQLLTHPHIAPGWYKLDTPNDRPAVHACVAQEYHPLAGPLLSEIRAANIRLLSLDSPDLGDLRVGFDELLPYQMTDSVDQALSQAIHQLQQDHKRVAVLSTWATQALSTANIGIGIYADVHDIFPWTADIIFPNLSGVWKIFRAVPQARENSRVGIEISASSSMLALLTLVPGVQPPLGPPPVAGGGVLGFFMGYLLARRIINATPPQPAITHPWHVMPVEQVKKLLPAPSDYPPDLHTHELTGPVLLAWDFARTVGHELADPMTSVLALCSIATAMLGSPLDAIMVGVVLVANAMLAASQQVRAEHRLSALLSQETPQAHYIFIDQDGHFHYRDVDPNSLRPGDVIEVRNHEVVPADARIINECDLEVDESSLTGESFSVAKQVDPTPGAALADRLCMLYAGSSVITGTAIAIVTAVGKDTQAQYASQLAIGHQPHVGLQYQLTQMMRQAFPISAAGGAFVGALGLLRQVSLPQALSDAIAVTVAAIPEGMPLMATLAQHGSVQRLSRTGALVRIPRSVEALGRLEIVCFDKTGTLSENRLRVITVIPGSDTTTTNVLANAAWAAPLSEGNQHTHATDQAIVDAAITHGAFDQPGPHPDIHLPFHSDRSFSASLYGSNLVIKGAPEIVLPASQATELFDEQVTELATQGIRVIAVAQRHLTPEQCSAINEDPDTIDQYCLEDLTFTGLIGLADTPRPQARQLLDDLAQRGIGIRIITGDHPVTACAIAQSLGVNVTSNQVITGDQWEALNATQQEQIVAHTIIFARMTPVHKVEVVQAIQRCGYVCAMVGDGVNDAAAIRSATVGVGVVSRGSDSAHTVADIVLVDGQIGALTDAIDEGRRLWCGVQRAVTGLMGGNAGEIVFSILGTALAGHSPLNTRQLLLVNMITDALPATAVAISTPHGPINPTSPSGIDLADLRKAIAVRAGITTSAGMIAWLLASLTGRPQRASTIALISIVAVELGQTLVDSHAPLVIMTSAGLLLVFGALISTPGISQFLGCTPIGPFGWLQALTAAGVSLAALQFIPSHLTHLFFSEPQRELPSSPVSNETFCSRNEDFPDEDTNKTL